MRLNSFLPQDLQDSSWPIAINSKRLSEVQDIVNRMKSFVDQVYVPDTLAVASFYKDWFYRGEGLGNFLCFGDLPATSMDDPDSFLFPRGAILNRDISTIHDVPLDDPAGIRECPDPVRIVSVDIHQCRDFPQDARRPFSIYIEREELLAGDLPPLQVVRQIFEFGGNRDIERVAAEMTIGQVEI